MNLSTDNTCNITSNKNYIDLSDYKNNDVIYIDGNISVTGFILPTVTADTTDALNDKLGENGVFERTILINNPEKINFLAAGSYYNSSEYNTNVIIIYSTTYDATSSNNDKKIYWENGIRPDFTNSSDDTFYKINIKSYGNTEIDVTNPAIAKITSGGYFISWSKYTTA